MSKRKVIAKKGTLLRASERQGIKLDMSAGKLRDLMTEQSRQGDGWGTYYTGTREEFITAGLPDSLFASQRKSTDFRANGQQCNITRKGPVYDLTILWDNKGPAYHSAGHPALCELARMILIHLDWWVDADEERMLMWKDRPNRIPTERLIECGNAVDYRLPASKQFRFNDRFRAEFSCYSNQIYSFIRNTEIMPLNPSKPVKNVPLGEGNVISFAGRKARRQAT